MLITIICGFLTLAYVLLIMAYRYGWEKADTFVMPDQYTPLTSVSVIIPARNEEANIAACLDAVLAQRYPAGLIEVIVVDDHSDDDTAAIVSTYSDKRVKCIPLADHMVSGQKVNAYKKAALAAGISQSHGELIVTTDADCIALPCWLAHIAAFYEQRQPVMIIAPVIFDAGKSIVQVFQLIDFMSMQGITIATHHLRLGNMSNGANLAFRRSAYEAVGGYAGISHLASGDDYLLMMKISKAFPKGIACLKSEQAIVSTPPQPGWKSFLRQRIRWASKSGKYSDTRLTAILLLVYLCNLSFLVALVAGVFASCFLYVLAGMLIIKIIAEYAFLIPVARFFHKRWVLPYFPFLQPLHIAYIVLAGFLGFIGTYSWKGRRVK